MLTYDGEFGSCRRCTDWVLSQATVSMLPSADLNLDLFGLPPAGVSSAVWLVADGERLLGHGAITSVLREVCLSSDECLPSC